MRGLQGQSSLTLRTREEEGPALGNAAAKGPARTCLPPEAPSALFQQTALSKHKFLFSTPSSHSAAGPDWGLGLCIYKESPGNLHFSIEIPRG